MLLPFAALHISRCLSLRLQSDPYGFFPEKTGQDSFSQDSQAESISGIYMKMEQQQKQLPKLGYPYPKQITRKQCYISASVSLSLLDSSIFIHTVLVTQCLEKQFEIRQQILHQSRSEPQTNSLTQCFIEGRKGRSGCKWMKKERRR